MTLTTGGTGAAEAYAGHEEDKQPRCQVRQRHCFHHLRRRGRA